jgi:hypothetical protein
MERSAMREQPRDAARVPRISPRFNRKSNRALRRVADCA